MDQFPVATHVIAVLLLLARIGDIGSTYLATPKLRLEANTIARRYKWPFAWATLLVAFLPYYNVALGIIILVASLLVCSSNFGKLWLIRAMGEVAYHEFIIKFAVKAKLTSSLFFILMPAICMGTIGFLLMYFYPNPETQIAYYFAYGMLGYALAVGVWGPLAFLRFRKQGLAITSYENKNVAP